MSQVVDNTTLKFLEKEIEDRISSFRSRTGHYRKSAYFFVLGSTALSAATTFLIGLGEIFPSKLFPSLALLFGATLTVLAAWDGFFANRQRWLHTNDTLMQLYELRSDIFFQKTIKEPDVEQLKSFYSQYQEILRQANHQWKDLRLSQAEINMQAVKK